MKQRRKNRKRPCRICRKWFSPDPRVGERQKTCGDKECQDKWHTKKCAEWNNRNPAYFREIYLSKKLALVGAIAEPDDCHPPPSNTSKRSLPVQQSSKSNKLPSNLIQEVIGVQHLIIIEYMTQLLFNSFQEETRRQLTEITRKLKQLPHEVILRGDSIQRGP